MTLLQQSRVRKSTADEVARLAVCAELRTTLESLIPGENVIVFGSLIRPGRFNRNSDVDLALFREPDHLSSYRLQSLLEERLGKRTDLILLPGCRFRERIISEGEPWTISG